MKCKEGIDRSKVNPGFLFFFFAWANSSMELPLTEMGETQVEPFWGGGDSGGGPKFRSEYIKLAIPITFRWRCWGYISFLKKIFYLVLERGEAKEKEGQKHQCVIASCTPATGNLARNPGMGPDWESNRCSFGWQAGTQFTEPHQPGWGYISL